MLLKWNDMMLDLKENNYEILLYYFKLISATSFKITKKCYFKRKCNNIEMTWSSIVFITDPVIFHKFSSCPLKHPIKNFQPTKWRISMKKLNTKLLDEKSRSKWQILFRYVSTHFVEYEQRTNLNWWISGIESKTRWRMQRSPRWPGYNFPTTKKL